MKEFNEICKSCVYRYYTINCGECGDNHTNYKYDKYLEPIVVTFGKSQYNSESIEVENE